MMEARITFDINEAVRTLKSNLDTQYTGKINHQSRINY